MRYKPDGSLDEVWRRPMTLWSVQTQADLDQMREELIENLLRHHPTMTRETATEHIDAVW